MVYGSLRRNEQAHRFMRNTEFVEEVRLPGYDLLALGWYPGIVPNPDNKEGVVGEVYSFADDGLLTDLDAYEGYNPNYEDRSLFIRREIEVSGKPTFVYEYNSKNHAFGLDSKVPSGDWSNRE